MRRLLYIRLLVGEPDAQPAVYPANYALAGLIRLEFRDRRLFRSGQKNTDCRGDRVEHGLQGCSELLCRLDLLDTTDTVDQEGVPIQLGDLIAGMEMADVAGQLPESREVFPSAVGKCRRTLRIFGAEMADRLENLD